MFGNIFMKWDWSHRQPDLQGFKLPFPNTAIDLATPHRATGYFIDHPDIPDELKNNVEYATHEAGHMMYIHEPSMVKFKDDLAQFLRGDE